MIPHNCPALLDDPLSEGCVFGGDGWGWWPPKLPVFVEHDDLTSMQNSIRLEGLTFRAKLSKCDTEWLQLANVYREEARRGPLRQSSEPAPQLMDSLPEQHIEDLPRASRQAAYEKVRLVFLNRWKGTDSEDEVARRAGFGSADAMHHQLSAWGFAGLLPSHRAQPARKSKPREHKARGSGPVTDLPPAGNALSIFQGTLEKLEEVAPRRSTEP